MKTETWYYCDRRCGYKTQDRKAMEEHERTCKCESLPVWQVEVGLDIEQEPSFTAKKMHFDVHDSKARDSYLAEEAEVKYACVRSYYWVCKFVRTEAETDAALEECKTKMRGFLLHLAGQVDGLELKKGEC